MGREKCPLRVISGHQDAANRCPLSAVNGRCAPDRIAVNQPRCGVPNAALFKLIGGLWSYISPARRGAEPVRDAENDVVSPYISIQRAAALEVRVVGREA